MSKSSLRSWNLSKLGARWWSRLSLRGKGLVVIAVPLFPLLISFALLASESGADKRIDDAIANERVERLHTETLLKSMLDAETGVRGYLLTRDDHYLDPYLRAQQVIPTLLDELTRTAGGHRPITIGAISSLVGRELQTLDELVSNPGLEGRSLDATLGSAKETMDQLRDEIARLAAHTDREIAADRVDRETTRSIARFMIIGSIGVALLFAAGGMLLLTRGIVRRARRAADDARLLAEGRPVEVRDTYRDEIGELHRALAETSVILRTRQEQLDEANAFLEQLIQAVPGAFVRADLETGSTTYVSPRFTQVTGHDASDVVNLAEFWQNVIHPDDIELVSTSLAVAAAERRLATEVEIRLQRPDGEYRWFHLPLALDYQPDRTLVTGYLLDVTERKEAEESLRRTEGELRQAKAAAENANRAKSDFLSRMSHELRTPLNAILGFTQLLELDELSDDQRENLSQVLKAGNHLLTLIDEVLDIARIEAGRLMLSIEPVALAETVSDAVQLINPLLVTDQIDLVVEEVDESAYVLADRQRLKQVLLNLLSNAIKYNVARGRIDLSVTRSDINWLLVVADTGIGMPDGFLDRLFTPFDRMGAEGTTVEGTGLGLSLSLGLMEAMNGKLQVDSATGEGTRFTIVLPATAPIETEVEPVQKKEPSTLMIDTGSTLGRTLLYIDDNLSNIKLVERVLARRREVRVISAMQGRMGLDLAGEHAPDLIMLDLNLPDMHGLDVLRRLKSDPATADIPVIIVSADATQTQITRLLNSGAAAYITKPFNLKEFLGTIDKTLELREVDGVA
jgi:PAS domain S-box-containing protein